MADFFDDEYEKQKQKEEQAKPTPPSDWYTRPEPDKVSSGKKPLYIVLLCFILVACIGLGWLLCYIFQSVARNSDDESSQILDEVMKYLRENYYQDISDEEWTEAIESSGTALMQTAGDRFCQLMSPQTYYDFCNPTATVVGGGDQIFGVSFSILQGVGMTVSTVVSDSPAYGRLQEGDLVVLIDDARTRSGGAPTLNGKTYSEIPLDQLTSDEIRSVLELTYSATFHVLRRDESDPTGYTMVAERLTRGTIMQLYPNYNYHFVEFYFGRNCTNVSTALRKPLGASTTTEEMRHLDELPADTGYVRITEFMDVVDSNGETVSASGEFIEVMQLFASRGLKHLVLDLKGNPGGNVNYVSDVAAQLITAAKLTEVQKESVSNASGELLVTTLDMPKPAHMSVPTYKASNYNAYFPTPTDKCDIVVWTDGNSASASELLTGCLLDYQTAVQMGTTTYGKGIAQTWQDLPFTGKVTDIHGDTIDYPWAVYYTCASYYSPLGVNIHGKGYTPTVEGYNGLRDYASLISATAAYWA